MPSLLMSTNRVTPESHKSSVNTLWECFAETVRKQASDTAIVYGELEISYGALAATVHTVENALRSLQPAPGERIALVANKTPEVVASLLAALHLRVTLVLINPLLKAPQIEHILKDSGAKTLLCQSNKAQHLTSEGTLPLSLERIIFMPAPMNMADMRDMNKGREENPIATSHDGNVILLHWNQFITASRNYEMDVSSYPNSEEPALILYTSGSTGKPKGVMLSHANLFNAALSVSTYLENSKEDRILALMPFSFDYGLSQLTTAVFSGATLVLHDYFVARGIVDIVKKHRITGIPAVPHLWNKLAKVDWPDMPHLRYITSTGARLDVKTIQALGDKFPMTELYSMYGFTEAFRTTFLPPAQLDHRPESIGKAVPLANVLVVASDGTELLPGECGELVQSGPLVSCGYWNDPEGTAEKFRPRAVDGSSGDLYAWSGDIAYKDKDGFLYFVSRKDDLVKLNGYRVSPSEIEISLLACPRISEACVLCIPDHRFGNVAVAFVVLDNPVESSELSLWCKMKMPSYMVPAKWIVLDELPVTPNNKLDRASLSTYLSSDN